MNSGSDRPWLHYDLEPSRSYVTGILFGGEGIEIKEKRISSYIFLICSISYRSQNRTPRTAQLRKSKRIEGRRFLTIGYDGEMRSPLRDRKNTPNNATVQRSKSAQTPSKKTQLHLNKKDKNEKENLENENALCRNVQRSLSLRSPRPPVVVPASLKETIYDITTPKSEKVKRQLSDRVMTPKGGRPEAVPFIKVIH